MEAKSERITDRLYHLIEELSKGRRLSLEDYEYLITNRSRRAAELLGRRALEIRREIYGNKVYVRGLIEISNHCKNDCLYCGIRRSNSRCERYRLGPEQIFSCVKEGYGLGFRTFVLQGGEDGYYSDELLCSLIRRIKGDYPDCAVTLSLGERGKESFWRLRTAGADRYLLRHETADEQHYKKLHPAEMSFEHRMQCLYDLKELGYQTGCGFMVGSPGQSAATIARDLKFVEVFQPDMCGIGPFIPHRDTPFGDRESGSVELTCYLLSLIRLIVPGVLLPATTALETISHGGRERGILAGANVVMPNLSPFSLRKKYELYNGKAYGGRETSRCLESLRQSICAAGFEASMDKGDIRKYGKGRDDDAGL